MEAAPGTGRALAVGRVDRSGLIPALCGLVDIGEGVTHERRDTRRFRFRDEGAGGERVHALAQFRLLAATPSPPTSPQSVVAVDETVPAGISQVTLTLKPRSAA